MQCCTRICPHLVSEASPEVFGLLMQRFDASQGAISAINPFAASNVKCISNMRYLRPGGVRVYVVLGKGLFFERRS